MRKRLRVTNAGHMYKWCWCLGLIKQPALSLALEMKSERGKLEIRRNNKQSHPTPKHFNMPTNSKRRGTEEMEGKCNRPKLNICQTWWKNGDVFCSVLTSTLPCSSLQTLNCIYELSDTFSDNKSSVEIARPLFLTSTNINIWIRCRFFKNFSFLFADAGLGAFFFEFPRGRNSMCCILFCTEWHLKLTSDEVYFLRLRRQTRPGK